MNMQQNNISENNFEQCIKCTVCTVYCPVIPVNPKYPGPKQAGPDEERLRLKRGEYFDEALKYCLNCKRCEVACPSNVKIGYYVGQYGFRGHYGICFRSCGKCHIVFETGENGDGWSVEDRSSSCLSEIFFPDIRKLVQEECNGFAREL